MECAASKSSYAYPRISPATPQDVMRFEMPFSSQGFFGAAIFANDADLFTDMTLGDLSSTKIHKLVVENALTDRGHEFCGNENHPYEPYPAL